MRIVTKKAVEAFIEAKHFLSGNTFIDVSASEVHFFLHNNLIARKDRLTGRVSITTAGWSTATTKARLNGIPGVQVYTKASQLYLNGVSWSGDWKTI